MKYKAIILMGLVIFLKTLESATFVAGVPNTSDTSLMLWLNGDTGVTTSGGSVTSWVDQAGSVGQLGANNATAATVGGPTYNSNSSSFNGHGSISFNGAQGLDLSGAMGLLNGSGGVTVFVVGSSATLSGTKVAIAEGANIFYLNNASLLFQNTSPNFNTITSTSSLTASTATIMSFSRSGADAGQSSLSLNGITGDNGAQIKDFASNSAVNVGYQSTFGPHRFWNGEIAEILVYNTALSAGDIANVNSYLNNKYFVAVPEPSTYGLILGSVLIVLVAIRRNKKTARVS